MNTINDINSKQYWDQRFSSGDWENKEGSEQTYFFVRVAIENLPKWMTGLFENGNITLCDAGCAEGQGAHYISQKYKNIRVSGYDFSEAAIRKAKDVFHDVSFYVDDIDHSSKPYDIIFCSNVLEHFPEPKEKLRRLLKNTKKHLILVVPFQEKEKFHEHEVSFDYQSFNLRESGYVMSFFKVVDTGVLSNTYWGGKQLLVVYSHEKNVNIDEIPLSGYDYIEDLRTDHKKALDLASSAIEREAEIEQLRKISDIRSNENVEKDRQIATKNEIIAEKQYHLNKIYGGNIWKAVSLYFYFRDNNIKLLQKYVGFRRHIRRIKQFINKGFRSKSTHERVFEKFALDSDRETIEQLQSWIDVRSNNAIDFFVFGITAYNFRYQRPQHIAEGLTKHGHRVMYIENEFCTKERGGKKLIHVKRHSENIFLIKLHSSKNYFIYDQIPNEEDITNLFNSIKFLIREVQIVNPIAKIDHPFWGCLRKKLSMPVVYDCMDNHSGFKESGQNINKSESDLISNSDLVLASSNSLKRDISSKRKGVTILLKNAGEYNHFIKATDNEIQIPEDLTIIRRSFTKVIGYYGAIADWFDAELVGQIADKYQEMAIVLVGAVTNDSVRKLGAAHKNIFLLGEKPYQLLPSYLKGFDICTIPFKLIPLIQATDPVKIYEYLAAGKAVVVTDMPELRHLGEMIYRANSVHEFIRLVGVAMNEKYIDSVRKTRQSFAKSNTWESRVNYLNKAINDLFFPHVSVIILSYGQWQYTQDCLNSLYGRSLYPRFETILIDNYSDKDTVEYINKHIDGAYPNLKVSYQKKNSGFGGGNNIGMRMAKGKYLVLLNNDTQVTPGWIGRLVYHAQDKGTGLVGPVTNNIGNESKIPILYNDKEYRDIEMKSSVYTASHWGEKLDLTRIAAFCWILSRDTYQKIGGFDSRFYPAFFEDDDYCLRVINAGYKIFCAEDCFIHHYLSASTKARSEKYHQMFIENKGKFENKWNTRWVGHKYRS